MVKARKPARRPPIASADTRRRVGRPVVAAADRRETIVRVLVTEAEQVELQHAAAGVAMSVSTWMRTIALERARQLVKKNKQEGHGVDSD